MLSLIHSCPGHSSSGVNGGAKMSPKGPRGLCLMASQRRRTPYENGRKGAEFRNPWELDDFFSLPNEHL